MKIVFICGNLEPGRDGVGDYVRLLALEAARQGNQTAAIALRDEVASEFTGLQTTGDQTLLVFRIPSHWPASKRFARAQQWLDEQQADWLSLQFVPFSFHPRGLSLDLSWRLARLGRGKPWHLMIHELWVGMDYESSLKHFWWGKLQRALIKNLIVRLKPKVIHTQLLLYQIYLKKLGFSSQRLALFANIPVATTFSTTTSLAPAQPTTISLVVFGRIHTTPLFIPFARAAARYTQRTGVAVTLVLLGRCGSEATTWATTWEQLGLPLVAAGEQSPSFISRILQSATLGISTTPAVLTGKSGTVAAMQEHGLPILCLGRPWNPRNVSTLELPTDVMMYSEDNFDIYLTKNSLSPFQPTASRIAQQFLLSLLANK